MKKILFLLLFVTGCANQYEESANIQTRYVPPEPQTVQKTIPRNTDAPVGKNTVNENISEENVVETADTSEENFIESENTSAQNYGYYETKFELNDKGRVNNLELATSAINNTVVQPSEIFSFNDTIGSTTADRGYQESIIFSGGKKTKGFGGGVCQVSTTLCNASHQAGMTILERHDHSRPVNYVGDGLQAATSHNGGLDFKFQNDTQNPVIIYAKAENGIVSVSVEALN